MRSTRDPGPSRLACDGRCPAGTFEAEVHAAGPVFLPDADQDLEVAPVMGVAGRVTHVLEGKVAGGIVMDEDARDVPVDIAGSGADAQDGQERGAQQVEPTGADFDADFGFVKVSDRGHGPDPVGDPVDDILEALCAGSWRRS